MGRDKTFQVLVIRLLLAILYAVRLRANLDDTKYIDKLKDKSNKFINNVTGQNKEWWRDDKGKWWSDDEEAK